MHLPDQDLAGLGSSEAALSGRRKASSVPRVQCAFRFKVHPAPGEVDVSERHIRDGDAFAGVESRDVEGGVAVADADRRLVPVPCLARQLRQEAEEQARRHGRELGRRGRHCPAEGRLKPADLCPQNHV